MSPESENGYSSMDFPLEPSDDSYSISLIQNPLIDYPRAMELIEQMKARRNAFKQVYGAIAEPPECSWDYILGHWLAAHWYQVDEYADRMIVGMSVAAWEGVNRTHKIFE